VDQVAAYARDIKNYHSESHDLSVHPILVLNKFKKKSDYDFKINICGSNSISNTISENASENHGKVIDINRWLSAEYEPLPSLVTAARYVFQNDKLPNIRRASAKLLQASYHSIPIEETGLFRE
jgi:hypothetical protein